MWEFFLGMSAASFFAVYWLKRGAQSKPRQCEVVYAPPDEVLQYKTRKKPINPITAAPYDSEEFKPLIINPKPSYRAPRVSEFKTRADPEKDEFVEYAASIITEKPVIITSQPANIASELPKNMPESTEDTPDNNEKKSKYNSFRFFNT